MKHATSRFTRAALLSAAAFLAAPSVSQQTAPVTPPPVVATPAPAPVTPPTVVPTLDRDASTNVTGGASDVPGADKNSTTPINPAAAAAEAEAAARRSNARVTRPASRPVASRPAPAPARAAPAVAAPTPAPEATVPTPEPSATPIAAPTPTEVAVAPVAVDNATETRAPTTESNGPPWLLIILGVLVLAGIATFLMSRRRRAEPDAHREPVATDPLTEPYVEPVVVAPVVAAPIVETEAESESFVPATQAETPTVLAATEPVDVAAAVAEDASVEEPEAADVAALTAAAPAGDRPWLELAMRPIRAGTNVDQALVEIELTVANAGTVQAEDVRISTFMLPAGADGEMDRLLSQSRVDAAVESLTIPAGEGTRVDATLALPRAELMANDATHFQPVVVADARYRLPDGGEGRTSASFVVGIASDGDLGLFELDRPVLREDVEARLYRDPARV